jgi:hypothetical protein
MEKIAFLFCVHNHQPVGNFLHVLENAYEKVYLPLIETVSFLESAFEKIFHGSSQLLYWPLDLKCRKRFEVSIELEIGNR